MGVFFCEFLLETYKIFLLFYLDMLYCKRNCTLEGDPLTENF